MTNSKNDGLLSCGPLCVFYACSLFLSFFLIVPIVSILNIGFGKRYTRCVKGTSTDNDCAIFARDFEAIGGFCSIESIELLSSQFDEDKEQNCMDLYEIGFYSMSLQLEDGVGIYYQQFRLIGSDGCKERVNAEKNQIVSLPSFNEWDIGESIECWKSVDYDKAQSYAGCEGFHFDQFMEGSATNANCVTLVQFDDSIPGGSERLIGSVLGIVFILSSVSCCWARRRIKAASQHMSSI